MSMRSVWIVGAVAAGMVAGTPAYAGHATQTLAVSTRVSPSALIGFEITSQPLEITTADLDRGYVEVVMKSRVRVAGSDAKPHIVMGIEPRPDLFRAMSVASAASPGGDGNGHANGQSSNGHSGNGNGHSGNGNGHAGNGNGSANGNGHSAVLPAVARVDTPSATVSESSAGQLAEFRYRFEFSRTAREGGYETAISVAIDL
jgi:hypothetical protein